MRSGFSVEWLAQSSSITDSHGRPPPHQALQDRPENTPSSTHRAQANESSSSAAEDTSDYESEGRTSNSPSSLSSPSPHPSPRPSPRVAGGRRSRTAFTAEQISCLEATFKKNAYLGTQDKTELCRKLQLSDKQVRNWFQNRRMKMKRSVQDALAHVCQAASPFLRYDVPSYTVSGLPPPLYVHAPGLQLGHGLPTLHVDQYSHYSQYGAVMPATSPHYYPQYY